MKNALKNLDDATVELCRAQFHLAVPEASINFIELMAIRRTISDVVYKVTALRRTMMANPDAAA